MGSQWSSKDFACAASCFHSTDKSGMTYNKRSSIKLSISKEPCNDSFAFDEWFVITYIIPLLYILFLHESWAMNNKYHHKLILLYTFVIIYQKNLDVYSEGNNVDAWHDNLFLVLTPKANCIWSSIFKRKTALYFLNLFQ